MKLRTCGPVNELSAETEKLTLHVAKQVYDLLMCTVLIMRDIWCHMTTI